MSRVGRKILKVFKAIIRSNPILMMYNFRTFQISSKMFLHYKTVFKYISSSIRKWMFCSTKINISKFVSNFSTTPPRRFNTNMEFGVISSHTFLGTILSTIKIASSYVKCFVTSSTLLRSFTTIPVVSLFPLESGMKNYEAHFGTENNLSLKDMTSNVLFADRTLSGG